MRKSEKLSDAIGEISDDIIEEAYTYKPKHDMHQRKASFKYKFTFKAAKLQYIPLHNALQPHHLLRQ